MSWVRVDDGYPDHPKVVGLSDAAFRLHVSSLCYASRLETDGYVPAAVVTRLVPVSPARAKKIIGELVSAGLFDPAEDGYVIHDYLDYNPSRDESEARRVAVSEQRRQAGIASGAARRRRADAHIEGNEQRTNDEQKSNGAVQRSLPNERTKREPRPQPLPDPLLPPSGGSQSRATRDADTSPEKSERREVHHEMRTLQGLWEDTTGGTLTRQAWEELEARWEKHGFEFVQAAIREAGQNNKRSWPYCRTVIDRCAEEGRVPGARKPESAGRVSGQRAGGAPNPYSIAELSKRREIGGSPVRRQP